MKAAPDCGNFLDERVLSSDQIDTIARWVDAGAPKVIQAICLLHSLFQADGLLANPISLLL